MGSGSQKNKRIGRPCTRHARQNFDGDIRAVRDALRPTLSGLQKKRITRFHMTSFRHKGNEYFYDQDDPRCYYYEKTSYESFLSYDCTSWDGKAYKAEWRIPTERENKELAKRLTAKFEVWDVI